MNYPDFQWMSENLWEQPRIIDIHREKLRLKHETKQKALDAIEGYVPEHVVEQVRAWIEDIIKLKV